MGFSPGGVTTAELNDAIQALSDHIDSKFETEFGALEERLDARFAGIERRFDGIERLLILMARDAGFDPDTIEAALTTEGEAAHA